MTRISLRAGAVAALAVLAACADRSPTAAPADGPAAPTGGGYLTVEFRCSATVASGQVSCEPLRPTGIRADLILTGGQIQMSSRNVSYDGVQDFTFEAAVTNLIHQLIGTTDGTNVASNGVRVFFTQEPYVTSGSGTIDVVPDGYGIFTQSNQPYYQYNQILDNNVQSSWKWWLFEMPPTVLTFSFTVAVNAPVRYQVGWIMVTPDYWSLDPTQTKQLSKMVFNQYGSFLPSATVSWSTSNASVATVSSSGLVTAVASGNATITATDNAVAGRTGTAQINVP
jgi:hypothetical protein